MVFVWRMILRVMLLTLIATTAVYFLGRRQSTPVYVQAILPDSSCPAPCWNGIRPAFIREQEITSVMNQLPDVQQVADWQWTFSPDAKHRLDVYFYGVLALTSDAIRLGDVLAVLGAPDYQTLQHVLDSQTFEPATLVRLFYDREQVILIVALYADERLSAEMPLGAVNYRKEYFARPFYSYDWLGHIWLDRFPPVLESMQVEFS